MSTTTASPATKAPNGTANGGALLPATRDPRSTMIDAVAEREIAEIRAQMTAARMFPRDEVVAVDRILNACTRQSLAEKSTYTYTRGGQDISGPSIRLAEVLAQNWGNVNCGVRELARRPGESVVEAFAIDLETNMRDSRTFNVAHVRDTKRGRVVLEEEREIYEAIANAGARRKRACILAVIPGDVAERAVKQCELTLRTKLEITPELLKQILDKFAEYKVTQAQIEAFIQRRLQAIAPAQVVRLNGIYNSMKDGMSKPADWFEPEEAASPPEGSAAKTQTERLREDLQKRRTEAPTQPERPSAPEAAGAAQQDEEQRKLKHRELRGALAKVWKGVDNETLRGILIREFAQRSYLDLTVEQLEDLLERTPDLLAGAQGE